MVEEQKQFGLGQEVTDAVETEIIDAEDAPQKECSELLAEQEEEAKQLKDRLLRLAAELENTRKRLEREKSEGICFANESLMRDLLPVIDNLERAVQHGESDSTPESILEGVRMTLKVFVDTLSKYGCTSFEAMGKAFDPNFHSALMQQETKDHPEKTVIVELEKGYMLRDRLLRPASVVVSKAPSDE